MQCASTSINWPQSPRIVMQCASTSINWPESARIPRPSGGLSPLTPANPDGSRKTLVVSESESESESDGVYSDEEHDRAAGRLSPHGRGANGSRRGVVGGECLAESTHQMWTILQQCGPNHLGL